MIKAKYTIKDFLPLISVFSIIIVISLFWVNAVQGDFMRWMELFMGLFFLIFSAFKLANLKGFAVAYREYDIVAVRYAWYGWAYPFIELGLGVLYLLSLFLVFTNILTIIVMTISAIGVYIKLRKKEKILCACLGAVFKIPMTWVTFTEDLLMGSMAILMLVLILV